MHCLILKSKTKQIEAKQNISQNNTFISMTKIEHNYENGFNGDSMMSEENLKKLLENENKMTMDENEKYKKFLQYMEKNYDN